MRPMNRLQLHLADWSILAKIKIIWTEINNLKNDGKNKLNNKIFVKHNRIKINLISCTSYINVTHTHTERHTNTRYNLVESRICVFVRTRFLSPNGSIEADLRLFIHFRKINQTSITFNSRFVVMRKCGECCVSIVLIQRHSHSARRANLRQTINSWQITFLTIFNTQ